MNKNMNNKNKLIIILIILLILTFAVNLINLNRASKIEQIKESNIILKEQINSLKTRIYTDSVELSQIKQNKALLEHEYENEKKKYRPTETILIEKLPTLVILSDSEAFRLLTNNLNKSTNH
jgi:hypothetical protein